MESTYPHTTGHYSVQTVWNGGTLYAKASHVAKVLGYNHANEIFRYTSESNVKQFDGENTRHYLTLEGVTDLIHTVTKHRDTRVSTMMKGRRWIEEKLIPKMQEVAFARKEAPLVEGEIHGSTPVSLPDLNGHSIRGFIKGDTIYALGTDIGEALGYSAPGTFFNRTDLREKIDAPFKHNGVVWCLPPEAVEDAVKEFIETRKESVAQTSNETHGVKEWYEDRYCRFVNGFHEASDVDIDPILEHIGSESHPSPMTLDDQDIYHVQTRDTTYVSVKNLKEATGLSFSTFEKISDERFSRSPSLGVGEEYTEEAGLLWIDKNGLYQWFPIVQSIAEEEGGGSDVRRFIKAYTEKVDAVSDSGMDFDEPRVGVHSFRSPNGDEESEGAGENGEALQENGAEENGVQENGAKENGVQESVVQESGVQENGMHGDGAPALSETEGFAFTSWTDERLEDEIFKIVGGSESEWKRLCARLNFKHGFDPRALKVNRGADSIVSALTRQELETAAKEADDLLR